MELLLSRRVRHLIYKNKVESNNQKLLKLKDWYFYFFRTYSVVKPVMIKSDVYILQLFFLFPLMFGVILVLAITFRMSDWCSKTLILYGFYSVSVTFCFFKLLRKKNVIIYIVNHRIKLICIRRECMSFLARFSLHFDENLRFIWCRTLHVEVCRVIKY